MKKISLDVQNELKIKFSEAIRAQQLGLSDKAEKLLKNILTLMPEAWDVQHRLAILLMSLGRKDEAIECFRSIANANPTHAASLANLASALVEKEEFSEAANFFEQALAINNQLVQARITLACCYNKMGHFEKAISNFEALVSFDANNPIIYSGLGQAFLEANNLPKALENLENAVRLSPQSGMDRLNFGLALRRSNSNDLANEQFIIAHKLMPRSLDILVCLVESLVSSRCFDEAKKYLDQAIQSNPEVLELYERRAFLFLDNNNQKAIEEFDYVLKLEPKRKMALFGLGNAYTANGLFAEAEDIFEKLIDYFPDYVEAYYRLSIVRKFNFSEPVVEKILDLIKVIGKDNKKTTYLYFALGKIYDDSQEWDKAFYFYEKANYLASLLYEYYPQAEETYIDRSIKTFSKKFVDQHSFFKSDSRAPIFIIGMPRSGTTLIEQIISSHPSVLAAGEVDFWSHTTSLAINLNMDTSYPECILSMTSQQAKIICNDYLNALQTIVGSGKTEFYITDKMPNNYNFIGIIAILFPNARFIHCKRDSMDNCLSIFFQYFALAHTYSFNLENLGHYYRQYERLMAHWHEVFKGRIFDVKYEDVINDHEYWSKQIINFIGLDWDEACLSSAKNVRTVKTPSQWQVRQPIYKTSVKRWKHYEKYLAPLKEALGYKESI